MKKTLAIIVLLGISGSAYADSVLEQLTAAGGDRVRQVSVPAVAAPVPFVPKSENAAGRKSDAKQLDTMDVDMQIRGVFNGQQYDIRDRTAGIDLNIHKDAMNAYAFSGDIDGRYVSGDVTVYGGGTFSLSASGINLDMRKFGDRYSISGFVDEKDGSKYMDVDLREDYAGRFSVWESGVDLDISKFGSDYDVRGDIELGKFGKISLSMVAVCVGILDSQKLSQTPQK